MGDVTKKTVAFACAKPDGDVPCVAPIANSHSNPGVEPSSSGVLGTGLSTTYFVLVCVAFAAGGYVLSAVVSRACGGSGRRRRRAEQMRAPLLDPVAASAQPVANARASAPRRHQYAANPMEP